MPSVEAEDIDDFVSRVNNAHDVIHGMMEGRINPETVHVPEEVNVKTKAFSKLSKNTVSYRRGSGQNEGYVLYCSRCRIEYLQKRSECEVCERSDAFQTFAQRRKYLEDCVRELKEDREKREIRRRRWANFEKHNGPRIAFDYQRWDVWEPDADEDDEDEPDPNDPRFVALEKDLKDRTEKRRRKQKRAEDLKKEGNACFARQEYRKSIEWYGKALDVRKDAKDVYTNRALARIRVGYFIEAIADCDSALEIAEFFGDGRYGRRDAVIFKAWMRKATASLALRRAEDAEVSIRDGALRCRPNDEEALRLLERCSEVRQEVALAKQVKQLEISGDANFVSLRSAINKSDWKSMLKCMQTKGDEARDLVRSSGAFVSAIDCANGDEDALRVVDDALRARANIDTAVQHQASSTVLKAIDSSPALALSVLQRLTASSKDARRQLIEGSAALRYMRLLLKHIENGATAVIGNLAYEPQFRKNLREVERPNTISRLLSIDMCHSVAAALGNLTLDTKMRRDVLNSDRGVAMLVSAVCIDSTSSAALGTLMNIAVEVDAPSVLLEHDIIAVCVAAAKKNPCSLTRVLGLLSRVAACEAGRTQIADGVALRIILDKGADAVTELDEPCLAYCVRLLALLRSHLTSSVKKPLRFIVLSVIALPQLKQSMRANAAMCVSWLASNSSEKELALLAPSINGLVALMRDDKSDKDAQRNAAIACAKLAKLPACLAQLRKLHAIEIMMSRAKTLLP